MTISAILLGLSQLIFLINFVYSLFWGPKADRNPWNSNTLEWTAPSPPPHGNFDGPPVVYRGRTSTASPRRTEDYLPQTEATTPRVAAHIRGGKGTLTRRLGRFEGAARTHDSARRLNRSNERASPPPRALAARWAVVHGRCWSAALAPCHDVPRAWLTLDRRRSRPRASAWPTPASCRAWHLAGSALASAAAGPGFPIEHATGLAGSRRRLAARHRRWGLIDLWLGSRAAARGRAWLGGTPWRASLSRACSAASASSSTPSGPDLAWVHGILRPDRLRPLVRRRADLARGQQAGLTMPPPRFRGCSPWSRRSSANGPGRLVAAPDGTWSAAAALSWRSSSSRSPDCSGCSATRRDERDPCRRLALLVALVACRCCRRRGVVRRLAGTRASPPRRPSAARMHVLVGALILAAAARCCRPTVVVACRRRRADAGPLEVAA